MACSLSNTSDDGYATASALVLCLAIALLCTAMTARSLEFLKLARTDLERSRRQAALDGAQFQAAVEMVRSGVAGPYHWGFSTDAGLVDVIAEPESNKLKLEAASALSEGILSALGVADPAAFRLRANAAAATATPMADLDPSPQWRACGPSVVSPLGQQDTYRFVVREKPGPSPNPASWHIGETWRVRVATPDGWSDDRIVRFTGDARRPAAVVMRVLKKDGGKGGSCDEVLGRLFGS